MEESPSISKQTRLSSKSLDTASDTSSVIPTFPSCLKDLTESPFLNSSIGLTEVHPVPQSKVPVGKH